MLSNGSASSLHRTDALRRRGGRLLASLANLAWPQDMPPPVNGWDRNNRTYLWLLGLLTPFMASTASVLLGLALFWAFASCLAGRLRFNLPRQTWLVAASCVLYVAVLAVATLRTMSAFSGAAQTIVLVPFLSAILVPLSCWRSPVAANIGYLASGAANGLYICVVLAAAQVLVFGSSLHHGGRITLFSGNPVPAAYAIVIFSVIAALELDRLSSRQRWYRLAAIAAGICSAILTGSISVLASLPVLLCVFLWRYRSAVRPVFRAFSCRRRAAGLLAAGSMCALALVLAYSPLLPRLERYAEAALSVSDSQEADSLYERLAMWNAAVEAARHAPLTGYGIQNRFSAIVPYLPAEYMGKISFSHTHNGFLTALVAGGLPAMLATVLMLVAPFVMVLRHAGGIWRQDLLALTLGGAIVYGTAGMMGIMFFQDATDAIFCWIIVMAAVCSVPENTRRAPES